MPLAAGKRICIAGGGIAGAAFALALEQACKLNGTSPMPSIEVFERDASVSTQENLGWSFGLMSEKGSGGLQVYRLGALQYDTCIEIHVNIQVKIHITIIYNIPEKIIFAPCRVM